MFCLLHQSFCIYDCCCFIPIAVLMLFLFHIHLHYIVHRSLYIVHCTYCSLLPLLFYCLEFIIIERERERENRKNFKIIYGLIFHCRLYAWYNNNHIVSWYRIIYIILAQGGKGEGREGGKTTLVVKLVTFWGISECRHDDYYYGHFITYVSSPFMYSV